MKNFRPANYEKDLNAQAFKDDKLGEFIISSYPTEEKMVGKDEFLVECGTHRMQRQGGEAGDGDSELGGWRCLRPAARDTSQGR